MKEYSVTCIVNDEKFAFVGSKAECELKSKILKMAGAEDIKVEPYAEGDFEFL